MSAKTTEKGGALASANRAAAPGAGLAPGAHRPEIDGLRAFAILAVVLFHAGLGCPGGFVGVDIFFVISGFLITGIIARELDDGRFSFPKFWERRVRRILPAWLFLVAVLLGAARAFFPEETRGLARQAIWMLLGLANIKMLLLTGGYFAAPARSLFLLHTWSLAVEEQFYLLMPLLLALGHRWFRRQTGLALAALCLGSLALSAFWGNHNDAANFYLLPSRAWELLVGCLGAWAVQQGRVVPEKMRAAANVIGLGAIIFSILTLREDPRWPTAAALPATLGTLLVLMAPENQSRLTVAGRVLSFGPARLIGLISYSVYLWHWPLLVYLAQYGPLRLSLLQRGEAVAAALALGAASWAFIEQPFRNKLPGFRVRAKPLLIGAAAAWVCLMAASCAIVNAPPRQATSIIDNWPGVDSILKYDATGHMQDGGLSFNAAHQPARCVVLGSSHGMMLGPVAEALCEQYHIPCAFFCRQHISGLFPADAANAPADRFHRGAWDNLIKKYLAQWPPGLAIIGGRWYWEMTDRQQFAATNVASFEQEFSNTVHWMAQRGWRVIVVGQPPELPFAPGADVKGLVRREYLANGNILPRLREEPELSAGRARALDLMRRLAGPDAAVVDPDPIFHFADRSIRYYGADGVFYGDEHHLNSLGAMELKPLLEPFFRNLASAR